MQTSTTPQKKRSRVKRHRVPFPLTDGGELFVGGEILAEFEGELAMVLWKSYKNVMLWAEADPLERGGLFTPAAAQRRRDDVRAATSDARIAEPLLLIGRVLDGSDPVAAAEVARACRHVSDWAAASRGLATSLLFMQAAALCNPLDADAACAVGKMARNRAEYARSETWFRQAIFAARDTTDWPTYSRAYLGLAKVYWQRGALPSARRCMVRAYRTASRHHLTELRGFALWDLGSVSIHTGRWEESRGYIRAAIDLFGERSAFSLRLMNDVAYAWTTLGWFEPALRVLRAIAGVPDEPAESVTVWGSVARAAGGAGEGDLLDTAVTHVMRLAEEPAAAAAVPDAWLDVAHGAATLRRWDLAESAALRAAELARVQGEGRVRLDAEATLDSVRHARRIGHPVQVVEVAPLPQPVYELALELEEIGAGAGVLAGAGTR